MGETMSLAKRKVIWAVDAFEATSLMQRQAVETLRQYVTREPDVAVEPVYVLTSSQLSLSTEFTVPEVSQYRAPAEKAMRKLCEDLQVPNVLPPKIIVQAFSATSQAVKGLSDYAERTGAEMLIVGSHSRSGFKRVLLGSFAEALLLTSKVPVMIAGSGIHKPRKMDHLLFPTDFSSHSDLMYRRVVDLAVELQARVTFYHAIPSPVEPVFSSGVYLLGGAWLPVHSYFSKEVERHQARAMAWAKWAKKQGVPVEVVIDTRATSIAGAIVELAEREKVGLIAMDAQSGPIRSALIGSIARQVVRGASCPVWVMRSNLLKRLGTIKRTPAFPESKAA